MADYALCVSRKWVTRFSQPGCIIDTSLLLTTSPWVSCFVVCVYTCRYSAAVDYSVVQRLGFFWDHWSVNEIYCNQHPIKVSHPGPNLLHSVFATNKIEIGPIRFKGRLTRPRFYLFIQLSIPGSFRRQLPQTS